MTAIDERPVNGHAPDLPILLTVPLADAGPAEKWPRQDDTPEEPRPWMQTPPGVAPLPIVPRSDNVPVPDHVAPIELATNSDMVAETRRGIPLCQAVVRHPPLSNH